MQIRTIQDWHALLNKHNLSTRWHETNWCQYGGLGYHYRVVTEPTPRNLDGDVLGIFPARNERTMVLDFSTRETRLCIPEKDGRNRTFVENAILGYLQTQQCTALHLPYGQVDISIDLSKYAKVPLASFSPMDF